MIRGDTFDCYPEDENKCIKSLKKEENYMENELVTNVKNRGINKKRFLPVSTKLKEKK